MKESQNAYNLRALLVITHTNKLKHNKGRVKTNTPTYNLIQSWQALEIAKHSIENNINTG